ncbi:GNAT family N-acetyltransferase [Neobacillus notoginsengisoli]|uniref:GNAT family N-acetyltransferase n=1 Tax=Neobacillus notoginsengisoli TaxID=1578198 RepID=A0A417YY25_9BACI|nr:GNAT family N-acetyltransferase [Neobacillus notoginsengisoli]RHW42555.1 GNAT family N-acetyltransferase [Neobacillus notoginsengisoli]
MLTRKQLEEIKGLQAVCEEAGGFKLKLNWDMLASRPQGRKDDFLHYEEGRLIGFIGLYGFGNKVELCGMVDPAFRRKGIFSRLLNEAVAVAEKRGARQILLNAPAGSESARAFLNHVPNRYFMTEYQMKWNGTSSPASEGVTLRPSTDGDHELEARLEVECFGFTEEEADSFNKELRAISNEDFYIIESEGKPVGKMRVDHLDGEAWIYGFAVLPHYQGRGIGRKALSAIIAKEDQKGYPLFLEVEAKNAHALRLYESVGFKSYHAQDYYEYI